MGRYRTRSIYPILVDATAFGHRIGFTSLSESRRCQSVIKGLRSTIARYRPVVTTNCSNNYGPYQFPEKLIPLCLQRALSGQPLPIYGDGQQVRDWLYVTDHCSAIRRVLDAGELGRVYNVGGWNEKANLSVVQTLCDILDELKPRADGQSYATQITFVTDRPGHDRRYAINATRIEKEQGWRPAETFETGLRKTVQWYLDNEAWVAGVLGL